MKVSFVINEPIRNPSGGYKVVYTYANEMVRHGFDVTIYYHCRDNVLFSNYGLPMTTKLLIARCLAHKGPKWFPLDKAVKRKIITQISNQQIDNADAVIATAADTASDVFRLSKAKGMKFYFIQGYEDWVMSKEELVQTYQYDMKKITVSRWLRNLVESNCNDTVECVLNGIDSGIFYIQMPPELRKNHSICMLFHDLESKGSKEGMDVIYRLQARYPDLTANIFGVVPRPSYFPDWVVYTHNADQKQLRSIYNNSAIYLSPSWNEGFGLTGAEAMMSGCALISTATDGAKEYTTSDNAILVNIHDAEAMYAYCCELFDNAKLRCQIAERGAQEVTALLNYGNAVERFIGILRNAVVGKE